MGLSKWRTANIPSTTGAVTGLPPQPATPPGPSPFCFGGFSVYNTTANTVTLEFYDGTSAAGNFIGTVSLTAAGTVGSSATIFYGDDGVAVFRGGVFMNAIGTTPAVKGSVFWA